MKLLILGGSGMLGHQLYRTLHDRFDTYVTFRRVSSSLPNYFNRSQILDGVDAVDFDSVTLALAKVQPDVVVNCIGVVKQQSTAKDPITCLSINALFPHRLARLCQAAQARLIHVSTDCVFSGKKGNYTEADHPDAEDLYGRSKLLGEIQGAGCLTLRTSIIGRELGTRQGLVEWFLSNQGKKVNGYRKAIFSGLTTHTLSELIGRILVDHSQLNGLWHVAAQPIDKFALISLVRDVFDANITIEPEDQFCCDRSLCADRFRAATGWTPPEWPAMIQAMRQAA